MGNCFENNNKINKTLSLNESKAIEFDTLNKITLVEKLSNTDKKISTENDYFNQNNFNFYQNYKLFNKFNDIDQEAIIIKTRTLNDILNLKYSLLNFKLEKLGNNENKKLFSEKEIFKKKNEEKLSSKYVTQSVNNIFKKNSLYKCNSNIYGKIDFVDCQKSNYQVFIDDNDNDNGCDEFENDKNHNFSHESDKEDENPNDTSFLYEIISEIFPQKKEHTLKLICNNMYCLNIVKDFVLTKETFKMLFVIINGNIGYFKDNVLEKTYEKGDVFGSYTLKNNYDFLENNQNEDDKSFLKAITDSKIYVISSSYLNKIFKKDNSDLILNLTLIESIPIIKYLQFDYKREIAESLIKVTYSKDEVILKDNSNENYFIYIEEGFIKEISVNTNKIHTKNSFVNYEMFLFNEKEVVKPTLISKDDTKCIILEEEVLIKIFSNKYKEKILLEIFSNIVKENNFLLKILNNNMKTSANKLLNSNNTNYQEGCTSNEYMLNKKKSINENENKLIPSIFNKSLTRNSYKEGNIEISNISNINKSFNLNHQSNLYMSLIIDNSMIYNKSFNQLSNIEYKNISIIKDAIKEKKHLDNFKLKIIHKNEFSIEKIIEGKILYIIIYGGIYQNDKLICGELELFGNSFYLMDINSKYYIEDTIIVLETKLMNLLNERNIIKLNEDEDLNLYNKLPFISCLSDETLFKIKSSLQKEKLKNNHIIKKNGKEIDEIIFIKEGKILKKMKFPKGVKTIKEFEQNEIIGLKEVFKANFNKKELIKRENIYFNSSYDKYPIIENECELIAECSNNMEVKIVTLSKEDLILNLSQKMYNYIINNFFSYYFIKKIEFKNLYLISELGQGAFGKVILVKYYNELYALKSISHLYIQNSSSAINNIQEEIENLKKINSPFVSKIKGADYDNNNLYLLLEYTSCLSLRSCLNWDYYPFKISNCVSIFVSLIIAINSYQRFHIIHRDIKPENIILNKDGTIKLIDFGLSKQVKNFTSTIIGTPYYMAPEVIQGNAYDSSIDYWSSAIVGYEILYKKNPFEIKNDINIMNIYKKILNSHVEFPLISDTHHNIEYKKDDNQAKILNSFKSLLSEMLIKERKKRIASYKKCKEILNNYPWEKHYDLNHSYPIIKNLSTIPDHFYNDMDEDTFYLNRKNTDVDIREAKGIPFKSIYFKHKYYKKYSKYKINMSKDYIKILENILFDD